MYKLWSRGWSYAKISKHCHRSIGAVYGAAKRNKWRKRATSNELRVKRNVDKDLIKTELTNARLSLQVRNKAIREFLESTKQAVTASDCVRIMEYTDKLGVGGDSIAHEGAMVPPEVLTKTLEMVKSLGTEGLKALGRWIVETFKTPEELLNGNGN
jgi:phosphopantetheine adenylyltransferase